MHERHLRIAETKLRSVLLPILKGQVFHMTTRRAYASIRRDGVVRSNQDGSLPFTYRQSENSYFRKNGCVSLFDLRTASEALIDETLHKFYFLAPLQGANPVFLVLKESCFGLLIPWTAAIAAEGSRAMVIPYVEAGYAGDIPLALVDNATTVEVRRKSVWQELREIRRRRTRNPNTRLTMGVHRLRVKATEGRLTKTEERKFREWEPFIVELVGREIRRS